MGVVKLQPGDISIVENAGTFLLWYDTADRNVLTIVPERCITFGNSRKA